MALDTKFPGRFIQAKEQRKSAAGKGAGICSTDCSFTDSFRRQQPAKDNMRRTIGDDMPALALGSVMKPNSADFPLIIT